jgi:hypothetical protein
LAAIYPVEGIRGASQLLAVPILLDELLQPVHFVT